MVRELIHRAPGSLGLRIRPWNVPTIGRQIRIVGTGGVGGRAASGELQAGGELKASGVQFHLVRSAKTLDAFR